jgi:hypothetical protein
MASPRRALEESEKPDSVTLFVLTKLWYGAANKGKKDN